ncbi:MAG: histidinol-phosphatase [Cyclobacteriaceae bacterium]|nr:histidinol-phosphatase [Cyclobacteriaceae bacterium]
MFQFVLLLIGSFLMACNSSETMQPTWYKGNLHTHTYWSDGDEFPELVLEWYKSSGYHFVALSDHNTLAQTEKWKLIAKSPLYEASFQRYLEKFGKEWVEYKTDTGRIQVKLKTYQEYKSKMEEAGFLIIPAEEITNNVNNMPVHINATNLQELITPPNSTTVAETMQLSVDAVLQQREKTGVPMFPHINHPNFYWAITLDDMISLRGEQFFEVYNGHPLVRNYGDSLHLDTERMWDLINMAYARRKQPLMYGLATDDSHNYHQFGEAFSNAGRGWVMVRAEKLDAAALIAAMEAGDFYASTGVTLREVSFENDELKVEIATAEGVNYKIEFIGVLKNENESRVLKSIEGVEGSFNVTDEYLFVRAKITSSKLQTNPFQEGDFESAWTQPVFKKVGNRQ